MLLINIFISSLCLWAIMYLNSKINKRIKFEQIRLDLFNLRDDLALMAMKGKIDQRTKEYTVLIKLLNNSIKILDQFSIVDFLRFLKEYYTDKKIHQKMNAITRTLNSKDPEYKIIVQTFFSIMYKVMDRHTLFIRNFLIPFLIVLTFPFAAWKKLLHARAKLLVEIEEDLKEKASIIAA